MTEDDTDHWWNNAEECEKHRRYLEELKEIIAENERELRGLTSFERRCHALMYGYKPTNKG